VIGMTLHEWDTMHLMFRLEILKGEFHLKDSDMWENNIKMDAKEIRLDCMDYIYLAQDRS
jgi:hypothetical protein